MEYEPWFFIMALSVGRMVGILEDKDRSASRALSINF